MPNCLRLPCTVQLRGNGHETHAKNALEKNARARVRVYLQGCPQSKECSASRLNCRYLKPYIKIIKAYRAGYLNILTIL